MQDSNINLMLCNAFTKLRDYIINLILRFSEFGMIKPFYTSTDTLLMHSKTIISE